MHLSENAKLSFGHIYIETRAAENALSFLEGNCVGKGSAGKPWLGKVGQRGDEQADELRKLSDFS